MDVGRFFYWLLVGALLGIGYLAILSIGVFLLAAAAVLIIVGGVKLGARRLWAVVIGLGAGPALLLAYDVLIAPPQCPSSGPVVLPPGAHSYVCSGPMDGYVQLAYIFGGIALVGVLLPVVLRLVRRLFRPPNAQVG